MISTDGSTYILELPNELITHIFSYIPANDLVKYCSLVCRQFYKILSVQMYWKTRIKTEHCINLSECETKNSKFDPLRTIVSIENHKNRWSNWYKQRKKIAHGHCATIDSLLLFERDGQEFCFSGSRDRSIRLWNVNNVMDSENDNNWAQRTVTDAHHGWIWNMAFNGDSSLYTASWDSTVKSWDISNSDFKEMNSINLGSAVQGVSVRNSNEIVATTFCKRTCIIDTRVFNVVAENTIHRRAVIGLCVNDNSIYTSGEDGILLLIDRRMINRIVKFHYGGFGYYPSISYHCGQLLCGSKNGQVELFDASNLNSLQNYNAGKFVRQVYLNAGCHLVLSKNNGEFQFKAYTPGLNSEMIGNSNDFETEPAKFDYSEDTKTLVIGNGDSSLIFYKNEMKNVNK